MKIIKVEQEIIKKKSDLNQKLFLSDLPQFADLSILHNTVFNKTVTGIGGTTLALRSSNSIIILMPFVEVVNNKVRINRVSLFLFYLKSNKILKEYI